MGLLFRKMLGIGSTISDEVNFEYMYDRQPPKTNLTHVKFKVTLRDRREETLKLEDWGIFDNESQALSSKKDNQSQKEEGDEANQKKSKGKKYKILESVREQAYK